MARPLPMLFTVTGTGLSLFLFRCALDTGLALLWGACSVAVCAVLHFLSARRRWELSDNTIVFLSVLFPLPLSFAFFLFRTQERARAHRDEARADAAKAALIQDVMES